MKRKKYINVHEALLPKYRGCHPIFWAILNGESNLGLSINEVTEGMDDGDIIGQFSFTYQVEDVKTVKSKIDDIVYSNLCGVVDAYIKGMITTLKQDERYVTYGAQRSIEDCYIDFEEDNKYLSNLFKALTYDYPLPRIRIRGESYEIVEPPEVKSTSYYGPVGRVVDKKDGITYIKTRDGYILVGLVRDCKDKNVYQLSDLIPIGYRFEYGNR